MQQAVSQSKTKNIYHLKESVLKQGGIYHNRVYTDEQRKRLISGTASDLIPTTSAYGSRHNMKLGTEALFSRHTGYTFKRGHPLKGEIEEVISRLHDGGITHHIRNK